MERPPGYSTKDTTGILFQILPDLDPIHDLVEGAIENLNRLLADEK